MESQDKDLMSAFGKIFTPTVQFPRWYQPNPGIGQILVHSQEEEDNLKARDWTPKPLPGSENVVAKVQTLSDVSDALAILQSERDLYEQQKATDRAEMAAKMAQLDAMLNQARGTAMVPEVHSEDADDAHVPGTLSDASDEDTVDH